MRYKVHVAIGNMELERSKIDAAAYAKEEVKKQMIDYILLNADDIFIIETYPDRLYDTTIFSCELDILTAKEHEFRLDWKRKLEETQRALGYEMQSSITWQRMYSELEENSVRIKSHSTTLNACIHLLDNLFVMVHSFKQKIVKGRKFVWSYILAHVPLGYISSYRQRTSKKKDKED